MPIRGSKRAKYLENVSKLLTFTIYLVSNIMHTIFNIHTSNLKIEFRYKIPY